MLATFRTTSFVVIAVAAAAISLSGCASSDSASSEVTLAATKSPVQLLRNEAADRIPKEYVNGSLVVRDYSMACATAEQDPKGTLRNWRSSVRVALKSGITKDVTEIVAGVAQAFADQGWTLSDSGSSAFVDLYREGSSNQIHFTTKAANSDAGTGAEIQIQVSGPCVTTAGADSDEVKSLDED